MPSLILAPGAATDTCPTCGGAMSLPTHGRRTGRWIRHCRQPSCGTATHSPDQPPALAPRGPVFVHTSDELPLTVPIATRSAMVSVAEIAREIEKKFDAKLAATGSDE